MVYVAQLVECLIVVQEVVGSTPIIHTKTYTSVAQLVEHRIPNSGVGGSRPSWSANNGSVAQLVERWIEDPSVGGSNPSRSTNIDVL